MTAVSHRPCRGSVILVICNRICIGRTRWGRTGAVRGVIASICRNIISTGRPGRTAIGNLIYSYRRTVRRLSRRWRRVLTLRIRCRSRRGRVCSSGHRHTGKRTAQTTVRCNLTTCCTAIFSIATVGNVRATGTVVARRARGTTGLASNTGIRTRSTCTCLVPRFSTRTIVKVIYNRERISRPFCPILFVPGSPRRY